MLSSLPNRPLYQTETDTLSGNEALNLAFPATPESIREDDDRNKRIHDLLLFMGETVATIAYQEAEEACRLVTKETDENEDAYHEVAYNKLLEYRGYDELDREEALKQAVSKLYGPSEEVIGANPEDLESLGDR